MKTQKIIFILTILVAGLCGAQTNTSKKFKDNSFKLIDTSVVSGQYYRLFDLNFSGVDTLKKVNADKRLDSLITFINKLKIGNIMVMYCQYSDKGDFDKELSSLNWDKAVAIKKYLINNGLVKPNIVLKAKCLKPNFKAKIKRPTKTKNSEEFAELYIINL